MLIIEWDKSQLTALSTDGNLSKVTAWPDGQRPTEFDSGHASWLKGELAEFLSKEKKVTLVLPREDAILRHLELPPTPDDEVLDVVRLQTTMRSSVSLEQVLLDYLPLNVKLPLVDELTASGRMRSITDEEAAAATLAPPSNTLHVLVATISSILVGEIRKLLESVGFDLVQVTLSSCGHASLLREALGPTAQAAFVVERDGRVETTAIADGQLLFAHSARVPHGAKNEAGLVTPLAMGAEISRGLFAARRIAPEFHPRRIVISSLSCGGETGIELKEALASQFECRVEEAHDILKQAHLGPAFYKLVTDDASITRLIGSLGVASGLPEQCRLDFLHPRKPAAKPDYRRVKIIAGSSAALVAMAVALGWQNAIVSALDAELTALNASKVEAATTIKGGAGDQKIFAAVDDWQKHAPRISTELERQSKVLPNTERLLWTSWSITAGAGEVYGKMLASGLAKTGVDVTELGNRMAESKQYRIVPRELAGLSKDPDYKQRFEVDATLLPPAPPPKVDSKKSPAAPVTPASPKAGVAGKEGVGADSAAANSQYAVPRETAAVPANATIDGESTPLERGRA